MRQQLTVEQLALRLDATLVLVSESLQEHGILVCRATWQMPPEQVYMLNERYADRRVSAVLDRHNVPRSPRPGRVADRFSAPVPLTNALPHEARIHR